MSPCERPGKGKGKEGVEHESRIVSREFGVLPRQTLLSTFKLVKVKPQLAWAREAVRSVAGDTGL
jgi:hypothetical protein